MRARRIHEQGSFEPLVCYRLPVRSSALRVVTVACVAGVTSCHEAPEPGGRRAPAAPSATAASGKTSDDGAAQGQDFIAQAHRDAFAALEPELRTYFRDTKPLATAIAWNRPLTGPRVPPVRDPAIAQRRADLQRKLSEIDAGALEVRESRSYTAYRFAVDRDAWWLDEGQLYSSDPHAYLRDVELWMAEAKRRLRHGAAAEAQGPTEAQTQVAASTEVVMAQLPVSLRRLTNLGPGHAASAAALARELAGSARELAKLAGAKKAANDPLASALTKHADALDALESKIAAAPVSSALSWDLPAGTATIEQPLLRPRYWSPERSAAVLAAEEDFTVPKDMGQLVGLNLERFEGMKAAYPPAPPGARSEVSVERCASAWTSFSRRLDEQGAGLPDHTPVPLDCTAEARLLSGQSLSDAELDAHLLREVFVPYLQREATISRGGNIGVVRGRATPHVSDVVQVVIHGVDGGRTLAVGPAIDQLRAQTCLSVTALSLHAGAGVDPDRLDEWLTNFCPARPPNAWKNSAATDPRGALRGLPAATLSPEPAGMARVAAYPWAPMGIAALLALPLDAPRPSAADAQGVKVEVEELSAG